jgi:hypothetical protein
MGALKLHGGPKKQLGTHGKGGFHGRSLNIPNLLSAKCKNAIA